MFRALGLGLLPTQLWCLLWLLWDVTYFVSFQITYQCLGSVIGEGHQRWPHPPLLLPLGVLLEGLTSPLAGCLSQLPLCFHPLLS